MKFIDVHLTYNMKRFFTFTFFILVLLFLGCSTDTSKSGTIDLPSKYTDVDLETLDKTGIGPVAANGQLQVIGTQLSNANGDAIQLRGMSSHGLQWYPNDINETSLDILAYNWDCDVIRLSLYAREGGYETNPQGFTTLLEEKIQMVIDRGLYVIIDWHQLSPGNPLEDIDNAKVYLTHMAEKFGHLPNVIYEICNEPNNCNWVDVKTYAEEMIPLLRAIDPDGVIIVGTHAWGSLGLSDSKSEQEIINNPVNAENIIYSFHFYADSHSFDWYGSAVRRFAQELPIMVSEFGTQDYSGDNNNNFNETDKYLEMFKELNISWINWNFSSDHRSGAVLKSSGNYTSLKDAGYYIRYNINNPANSWD